MRMFCVCRYGTETVLYGLGKQKGKWRCVRICSCEQNKTKKKICATVDEVGVVTNRDAQALLRNSGSWDSVEREFAVCIHNIYV